MVLRVFASNNFLSPFLILKSFFANFSWDFREPLSQASAFTRCTCKCYCRALHLYACKIQWWSLLWNGSHRCAWSVNWRGAKMAKKIYVHKVDSSWTAWKFFEKVHLLLHDLAVIAWIIFHKVLQQCSSSEASLKEAKMQAEFKKMYVSQIRWNRAPRSRQTQLQIRSVWLSNIWIVPLKWITIPWNLLKSMKSSIL